MNIVFDIGNVLIAWNPYAAFRHAFESDAEIDAFLMDADFYARTRAGSRAQPGRGRCGGAEWSRRFAGRVFRSVPPDGSGQDL